MRITGLEAGIEDSEVSETLAGFSDGDSAADYAREGVLAPKDNITRAEVAVVVRRLLQKSGLICMVNA